MKRLNPWRRRRRRKRRSMREEVVEVVVEELDNCDAVIVLVAWAEDRNTACVGSNP